VLVPHGETPDRTRSGQVTSVQFQVSRAKLGEWLWKSKLVNSLNQSPIGEVVPITAGNRYTNHRHGLGLEPKHDQLLRVANEAAHGIRQLHDLWIAELLPQLPFEIVVRF